MSLRIKNIYPKLKQNNLDALLVSSPANITYLTRYSSRDSYFLVCPKSNIYFTDSRYIEEAKKHLKRFSKVKETDSLKFKTISGLCKRIGLKRIGFEEIHTSFAEFNKIKNEFGGAIKLMPVRGLIEDYRKIKDAGEIEKIRIATQITVKALRFIRKFITPGIREIEVAAELERFIRYSGGQGSAFNIIVASGPNSSYPHHITSQRIIRNNEVVLIDVGTDYQGYKSDLTRVFFLGKINPLARRIYSIVLKANTLAINQVRPGIPINKIDAAGRGYIAKSGYGKFFGHGIGHGIGLVIHEAPGISGKERALLEPGMVFTIEPAIYLPGKFGIRIEDTVLVAKKGCEVLSGSLDK